MEEAGCICTGMKQKLIEALLFIKQILTDPTTVFSKMARQGGFTEPVLFMATIGVIAGIVKIIVTFFFMANGAKVGLLTALSSIVIMPITIIAVGYIGAFLLSIIMRLMGKDDTLEIAFRVVAYLSAISPLAVLLLPIPYLGSLVIMAVLFYLLKAAGTQVYELSDKMAGLIFGIGIGGLALFALGSELLVQHTASHPTQVQTETIAPAKADF